MKEKDARSVVRSALASKRWSQADLSRAADVDKNTISDFLTGKRQASLPTLAKIEVALGMTPGTLAAIGEEPLAEPSSALSDAELLAELGYRLTRLQRENDELRERLTQAPTAAVTPLRPTPTPEAIERMAARGGHVVTNPELTGQQTAGEHNQDTGGWEPA